MEDRAIAYLGRLIRGELPEVERNIYLAGQGEDTWVNKPMQKRVGRPRILWGEYTLRKVWKRKKLGRQLGVNTPNWEVEEHRKTCTRAALSNIF